MAAQTFDTNFEDMEAFYRVAKYTLVKHTDMTPEMKEEVRRRQAPRRAGTLCRHLATQGNVATLAARPARAMTSGVSARRQGPRLSGPAPERARRRAEGGAGQGCLCVPVLSACRPWTSVSQR